jgi:hypothetical protein
MNLGGLQRNDEDRPKDAALPCGRQKVIALGLCASCYNLKRQNEECFGAYENRSSSGMSIDAAFATPRAGIRVPSSSTIVFHHRLPGKSLLHLMISLPPAMPRSTAPKRCSPACRNCCSSSGEQYPNGREQTMLDLKERGSAARKVPPLFAEDREGN